MSEVREQEVGDNQGASLSVDRVQELCVSGGSIIGSDGQSIAPLLASLEEREVVAVEGISRALAGISKFLSGITLQEIVKQQAVHGAVGQILGGLAANDGRGALDARTMGQNAIDMAYLIEKVLGKVTAHALSRSSISEKAVEGGGGYCPEPYPELYPEPSVESVMDGEELMGIKVKDAV